MCEFSFLDDALTFKQTTPEETDDELETRRDKPTISHMQSYTTD